MASTALHLHIPVDRLEIVDGPSSKAMSRVYISLLGIPPQHVVYRQVEFTFRSAASEQTFRRHVNIAHIKPSDGSGFLEPVKQVFYTGIFFGVYVEGFYNLDTKTGTLDVG